MCDECKKHGCPPPVYEIIMGESGDILVRIDSAPDAIVNAAIGEQITGSTNEYVGPRESTEKDGFLWGLSPLVPNNVPPLCPLYAH